jgi:hypothetical protein
MKKVQPWAAVITAAVLLISSANAGGHERAGRYESMRHVKMSNHHHTNWVVPMVIGGVLGYALSEPRRESVTYVQSAPVPVVYAPQPIYQEQWVYFSDCDCQRKVLVRVR